MHILDWSIMIFMVVFITIMALTTRSFTKSVADFLAANRCAGRYILAMAEGEAAMGAISVVALFEMWQRTGFTNGYWNHAIVPIGLIMTLTGFVYYRYRQTRAMTLAQFFEMRYSKNFRIFAGILAWISGLVNFGIFPVIGARFFMNFCDLPSKIITLGVVEIDMYLALVMLILLGLALLFTFIGGQIAVLVTDFWQSMFATITFLLIVVFLLIKFRWPNVEETLIAISKPGESLINPFDIGSKKDFNFMFFATLAFFAVYNRMVWQGTQGYNCAAITAHEAKMSKIVGGLRNRLIQVGIVLIPCAALTFLFHPSFAESSAKVSSELIARFPDDQTLQSQMRIPIALKYMLPTGLVGAFSAAMLGFFISTNNTYMHSWGSIFVQDVLTPLLKKPLTQKQHMFALRLSICFVAAFAFFFGLLFPLKEYIYMFFAITGAIFCGGAGAVIIGGLYWKRGTNKAAFAAMILGSGIAVASIVLREIWTHIPALRAISEKMPVNSQIVSFWAAVLAVIVYIVVSLLDKKPDINMDRLLHRGEYAVEEEESQINARIRKKIKINRFWKMLGVNSKEFSRVDKGLFVYMYALSIFEIGSFFILMFLQFSGILDNHGWMSWWKIWLGVNLIIAFIGGFWVLIGGCFDLKTMYVKLSSIKRNIFDDGRVSGDHLLADEAEKTMQDEENSNSEIN